MAKPMSSIESGKGGKCVYCGKDAIVSLPYGPHRFCKEHFIYFFEKRVRRTIRMNRLIEGREKIAVAVSGGKDSLATLFILNKIFGKSNEIVAVMVDEGIYGYRDKAIEIAKRNCEEWGIKYEIVSMKKELGISMTEVMSRIPKGQLEQSSCSYCGVFRRKLLNEKAGLIKAKKIATGHNLDDECQSILMNIASNDLPRLARLGPTTGVKKFRQFVPRIKPLYECPENEVHKFAELSGFDFCKAPCCPYSWQAKRNIFRKIVNELEEEMPGTKFSILASFRKMKPLLKKEASKGSAKACEICGSPTNAKICSSCGKLKGLKELFLEK